jgi:hypothetical protein
MRMLALKERVSSPKGDPGFPVRLVCCPIETSNKTPTCLNDMADKDKSGLLFNEDKSSSARRKL